MSNTPTPVEVDLSDVDDDGDGVLDKIVQMQASNHSIVLFENGEYTTVGYRRFEHNAHSLGNGNPIV